MSQGPLAPAFGITAAPFAGSLQGHAPICAPVYVDSDGALLLAQANASTVNACIGLAIKGGVASQESEVQYSGTVAQGADIWDNLTGDSGGLTPGARYYVSSAVAGGLTKTKPAGGGTFVFQVGIALSANVLELALGGQ